MFAASSHMASTFSFNFSGDKKKANCSSSSERVYSFGKKKITCHFFSKIRWYFNFLVQTFMLMVLKTTFLFILINLEGEET